MSGRRGKWLKIVGAACLAWLLLTFDFRAVARLWAGLPAALIAETAGFGLLVLFVKFVRWDLLLRINGVVLPPRRSARIFAAGAFWGLASPGRLGEFSKCAFLRDCAGVGFGRGAWLILCDRVYDLAFLLAGLVAGLCLLYPSALPAAVLCAAASAWICFWAWRRLPGLAARMGARAGLELDAGQLLADTRSSFADWRLYALSALSVAAMAAQGLLAARAGYGLMFSLPGVIFVIPLLNLVGVLPVSVLGFGTGEVALLAAVSALLPELYSPERLIAFSLSLNIINSVAVFSASGLAAAFFRRYTIPDA